MKYGLVPLVVAVLFVTGCTSYVRVYDADNKPIKSCMVKTGLFGRGPVSCHVPNLNDVTKAK